MLASILTMVHVFAARWMIAGLAGLTDHAGNNPNRRGRPNAASQYKGVSFRRNRGKWQVHICHRGRVIYLGYFSTEVDAARAYDQAVRELHGEFAYTNF